MGGPAARVAGVVSPEFRHRAQLSLGPACRRNRCSEWTGTRADPRPLGSRRCGRISDIRIGAHYPDACDLLRLRSRAARPAVQPTPRHARRPDARAGGQADDKPRASHSGWTMKRRLVRGRCEVASPLLATDVDPHRFRRHHPKWHDGLRGENRKWDRLARSTPRNIRTRLWSW